MFVFTQNLQFKHKVTLCLVLFGFLANVYLLATLPQIPIVEIIPEENTINISVVHIVLAFGAFVKMLVLAFFRKF